MFCTAPEKIVIKCRDSLNSSAYVIQSGVGHELRLCIFRFGCWFFFINLSQFKMFYVTDFCWIKGTVRTPQQALSAQNWCSRPGWTGLGDSHPWGCQLGLSLWFPRVHLKAIKSLVEPLLLELLSSFLHGRGFVLGSRVLTCRCLWLWGSGCPELPCTILASGWWHLQSLRHSPCSCASQADVSSLHCRGMCWAVCLCKE